MNKEPKITRREQQAFVTDETIKMLHFAVRACPCDGVNCPNCNGKMKYFDDPVPIKTILSTSMNSKKKEANLPTVYMGEITLLIEPRFRVAKGDHLKPFGIREFEEHDEVLPVENPFLTHTPVNPRMVTISFVGQDGVINYKPYKDFEIKRKMYGRIPLWDKEIRWLTEPPSGQDKFSVRYGYTPDFEIDEIPNPNISQGQLLIQQIKLKKIIIAGQEKQKSYENSNDALIGMKYE
jgi:hypothetical protein